MAMQLVRQESTGTHVQLEQEIASGGEGRIYSVRSNLDLVAKIYHHPTQERAHKLTAMIAQPPSDPTLQIGHISIAWPTERLVDAQGACVGFLMPFIDYTNSIPLLKLYHPADRQQVAPSFTWEYLLRTATNLASALDALHGRDYVVGDLNESNILVSTSALVTLVDCDSMQVPNGFGAPFRCKVGKPDYTPPELQGRDLSLIDRTAQHDVFGLAVLTFMLLMEGFHPFDGVWQGAGVNPNRQDRIRAGTWAYGDTGPRMVLPSPVALPFTTLPPRIQMLMKRCFSEGAQDPSRRPSAREWHLALNDAERQLVHCRANNQHVYSNHLNSCPWCERIRILGVADPFPLPGQQRSLPRVSHTIPRPTSYTPPGSTSLSTPTMPSTGYPRGAGTTYQSYAPFVGAAAQTGTSTARRQVSGFAIVASTLGAVLVLSLCAFGILRGFAQSPQGTIGNSASDVFNLDQLYTYNTYIGHSKTTSLTNDNVTVTLVSLGFNTSGHVSMLVVSFYDPDPQKGAHFLFQQLTNVYMTGEGGRRYQAMSATPDEVLIDPGKGGTVAITFPLIDASVQSLTLNFNTDKNALITPCVTVRPSAVSTTCPTS